MTRFCHLFHSQICTISSLCYSAAKGETILFFHSEHVQECFYDIFNQRFTSLSGPDRNLYFSTVAVGQSLKLCEISSKFQCLIVVSEKELPHVEPAFLNRFEKYNISYSGLMIDILSSIYPKLKQLILNVEKQVNNMNFVK